MYRNIILSNGKEIRTGNVHVINVGMENVEFAGDNKCMGYRYNKNQTISDLTKNEALELVDWLIDDLLEAKKAIER